MNEWMNARPAKYSPKMIPRVYGVRRRKRDWDLEGMLLPGTFVSKHSVASARMLKSHIAGGCGYQHDRAYGRRCADNVHGGSGNA